MLSQRRRYFAPPELQSFLGSWLYKHLVPPGTKTITNHIRRLMDRENFRDMTLPMLARCKVHNREGREWLNYCSLQPLSTLKLCPEFNTGPRSGHHPRNPRFDDANLERLGNTAGRS